MHSDQIIEEQEIFWIHALNKKKKHLDKAKKYAGDQDVSWWDTFFKNQHTIINNYIQGNWHVHIPFTWSIHPSHVESSIPRQAL